jgi:predicted nucleic acid-binding protein
VIFADTSVWIAAFRSSIAAEAVQLRELLERDEVALAIPVKVEILIGATIQDRDRLRRVLSALPVYQPKPSTWELIDSWIDRAAAAGERFGFADMLIGALAVEAGATVWSLDGDFKRMAAVGLIELHRP